MVKKTTGNCKEGVLFDHALRKVIPMTFTSAVALSLLIIFGLYQTVMASVLVWSQGPRVSFFVMIVLAFAIDRRAGPEIVRALEPLRTKLESRKAFIKSKGMLAIQIPLVASALIMWAFEASHFSQVMAPTALAILIVSFALFTMILMAIGLIKVVNPSKQVVWILPPFTSSSPLLSDLEAPYEPPRASLLVTA